MRNGLLRFGSLLLFTSLLLPSVALAQGRMGGGRGQQQEVERVIPETYKLPGYRHGVGFFPHHGGVGHCQRSSDEALGGVPFCQTSRLPTLALS